MIYYTKNTQETEDLGRELAKKITEEAIRVQSLVDVGISKEELHSFYSTLEKLYYNFNSLTHQENQ